MQIQTKKRLRIIFQLTPVIVILGVVFASVLQIKQVREFFGKASGEKADIVIDTQALKGPIQKPWQNFAQGGEQSDWRMKDITSSVKALQPAYIRIDHIYSFYDIAKKDGALTFDFSKLDPLLDDIKAVGATPFIALSYMPTPLAQSDIVSAPKDWNEYQLLIQKTIEHISGTRGFSDVYYEVWNEPDLFGGWKTYGDKNYLTLYTVASKGATAAKNVKPFKFGGPGITALYENWFVRLTEHAEKNNLRYDFFSWHRYNMKLTQFTDDYTNVRAWKDRYPNQQKLELLITEWGHDPKNHAGYDTSFGAAHTAAAAIEMVGQIDRGFVFEVEDGKDPAGQAKWGRWGLLTHQSAGAQPKPRYSAITMLNRLTGAQLDLQGNGSWVKALATRTTDNHIQVALANYDEQAQNVENVPITFTNILPGEYTLKQSFLGGRENTTNIATTAAELATTVTMSTNSVALLELIPTFETVPLVIPEATPAPTLDTTTPAATTTPSPVETTIPTPTATPLPRSGFGRLLE